MVLHSNCSRFRVQSSTVKVVKAFDFESNEEFIRALKYIHRSGVLKMHSPGWPWYVVSCT